MRRVRLGRPDHQRPARPPVDPAGHHRPRVRRAGPGRRVGGRATSPIGQRVVVDPDPKCGACDSCRAGRPANCTNIVALGVYRDGALARYVTAPANSVYPISDDVPAELAALVEPLACVVNGTNRAAIRPGESAVVFGAGAIGCLFIAVFRASGAATIVAIEPSPARAPVARAVGADVVLTPDEWAASATRAPARVAPTWSSTPSAASCRPAIDAAGDGRAGRRLRDERQRPAAGPPGRDRREGPVDPRLLHLELHLPGRDPARRERPARPRADDHAPSSRSRTRRRASPGSARARP